ncbi:hypothetical protein BUALT_Bualt10G0026200 [Buddleja alternifolia]|uniref:Protein transport protein sec16 n=1 Tax=Buddleja alternifolia TaxID=168488 RepID=A0AAV6WVJ6_9LAMI|nr:hypothetical protein BUALT_Bualt10G0026200 [Buddleja alternifolia]
MASNPPPSFLVEDNTDEDFFDKLVNDDDDDVDFKASTALSSANTVFTDGNESDESKAFASLSINELYDNGEVTSDKISSGIRNGVEDLSAQVERSEQNNKVGTVEEMGNPLVSSTSFEFDNLIQKLEKENDGAEVLPDATIESKRAGDGFLDTAVVGKNTGDSFSDMTVVNKNTDGSGSPGVKEVQWSAFHADDSVQSDTNGFGSYSDFFSEFGGDNVGDAFGNMRGDGSNKEQHATIGNDIHSSAYVETSTNFGQYSEGFNDGTAEDQSANMQDLNSSQYWENQYPGWKYDQSTGQWYEVDGYAAGSGVQANAHSDLSSSWGVADGQAEFSYLQQTAQPVSEAVAEAGKSESVTNWNQSSQESSATEITTNWNHVSQLSSNSNGKPSDWNQTCQDDKGYPPHMVFDPQYPGWYYDTIAQEWRTLESYTASAHAHVQDQNMEGYAATSASLQNNDYSTHVKDNSYFSQSFGSQGQDQNWASSISNSNQQNSSMWLPETVARNEATSIYSGNQPMENHNGQKFTVTAHGSPQNSVQYGVTGSYYENLSQGQNEFSMPSQSSGFVPGGNLSQQFDDSRINQKDQKHLLNEYNSNQNSVNFSQQQIQNAQTSYAPASGRSSAGRPAHALVAFGFGGKLIVMKENNSTESFNFGNQNPVGGSISLLNLAEVVSNIDSSQRGMGACNYFQALCQLSAPGPLTGGSVGTKELNKWIDERITNLESADMDYRKIEVLRLLLSLLKIACQYYGKLRSPYGTDAVLKESDSPESAVAKLFASSKAGSQFSQYGAVAQCLQQMPSEGQMRVTAAEVQNLLVSGKKKEALQCAQEGQLWGLALVLAGQLGNQFYVETIKQMAVRQLVAGSPLRTLCLLIAGQPADVFSADSTTTSSMTGFANMPQQPAQFGANGMLDDWEANLAVITANRTKDDELVLIHLGDCLWKDRSDIIAAHICYLVAERSFEPYSDSARLCLVGADHLKFPRTYASPEAIQRTEIYEYSKTLGNSQFVLLPFQPYKLVYAHMLAEVGRISEALKYCQAVLKSLKTGRTPEVETLRHLVSSLEERIKAHQQGGFSTNLAPKEFIGKLLNLFDSTAHRVVGGLPPPVPTVHGNENHHQSIGPRVSSSQSTMAMSSLVPSQSVEPISEWAADSNRMVKHARSVSEPDFGRSPMQGQSNQLKEESSTGVQDKASSGGTSRFGRFSFGSQLLQKTVGLVLKPRQGRQAKLGDSNKFYYDEKLKRWVEEGAEPPAAEAALPPPPPTAVFQNGTPDYNLKGALQSEASHSNGNPEFKSPSALDNNPGMPPLPPTSNQYSARGRMGVRSRYVDTFNKGGGNATNLFQSPSAPSIKPTSGVNPKFFVPAPVFTAEQQPVDAPVDSLQDTSSTYENPSTSPLNESFQSLDPPSSSATMQRFPSMNNISNKGPRDNGSFSVNSRRTASWSGSFNDNFSPPQRSRVKPLGEVLGMHPSEPSVYGGSSGDELHEVEL